MEEEPGPSKTQEKPIYIKPGGDKYHYRCGKCDVTPMKSKHGIDAHIRSVHTKKALLCMFCTCFPHTILTLSTGTKGTSTSRTFSVCTHWGNITVGRGIVN